jgi:hypothetical protein
VHGQHRAPAPLGVGFPERARDFSRRHPHLA